MISRNNEKKPTRCTRESRNWLRKAEDPRNTVRTSTEPNDRRNPLETRSLPTPTWRKSLQPTTQGELSSKHLGIEKLRSRTHHRNKRCRRDQSATLARRNRHPLRLD